MGRVRIAAQGDALPAPGFHHLHLNSTNPDRGDRVLHEGIPRDVEVDVGRLSGVELADRTFWCCSRKVAQPPATQPQTAVWHFGWHVTNERQTLERFTREGVTLLPLYTSEEGGTVAVNSDTWPGTGGVLGLTKAQIAEAKARGVKPNGGAGFGYIRGPDDALIEYQGDMPAERFNHVHLYQEHPFCAQLWYRTHLNAAVRRDAAASRVPRRTARCRAAPTRRGRRSTSGGCTERRQQGWSSGPSRSTGTCVRASVRWSAPADNSPITSP